jgi:hypothetical protein
VFSYLSLPDMFSAVPSASGHVFMFCAPGLISTVPRASGPVFKFCVLGLFFGGNESVGTRFHVLSCRTRFRWYRGRRLSFYCILRPDSFSAVPRASTPDFKLCAPVLIFDGNEDVRSRFHVLCSRTCFLRCRVRLSFSHLANMD